MGLYSFKEYPDFKSRQQIACKHGFAIFTGSKKPPGRIMALAGNSGRKRLNEPEIKDTLAFWRFWGFRK